MASRLASVSPGNILASVGSLRPDDEEEDDDEKEDGEEMPCPDAPSGYYDKAYHRMRRRERAEQKARAQQGRVLLNGALGAWSL